MAHIFFTIETKHTFGRKEAIMFFSDNALRTEKFNDLRDFSDLAVSFVHDIRDGFLCRTEGNGMRSAGIRSGDYLLFTKDREAENGDIVYLEVYGQFMCRRIFFEPSPAKGPGKIRIRREDGRTPDLVADERDVHLGGVFAGLVRKSRKKEKIYQYLSPSQTEEAARKEREKEKMTSASVKSCRPEGGDPSMKIDAMGLPARLTNRLLEMGMRTAKDVLDIPDKEAMLAIPGLGRKSYERILETLDSCGFDTGHLCW